MDPISGLKEDAFQRIVTTLIPGLTATWPYIALLMHSFETFRNIIEKSEIVSGVLILLIGLGVGMCLENLGSWIEIWHWTSLTRKPENKDWPNEWNLYLQARNSRECNGEAYLLGVLTRLKFELAMIPAAPICMVGILWWDANARVFPITSPIGFTFGTCIFAGWLVFESRKSVTLLANIRKQILLAENRRNQQAPNSSI